MNGIEIVEQREQQTTQDHHEHMDAELRTRLRHARRSLVGYVEEVLDLMDNELVGVRESPNHQDTAAAGTELAGPYS